MIYGVQVELGLGDIANGLSGNLIRLVQYALYVNMKEYLTNNGGTIPSFTGSLDAITQNVLSQFQNFMKLDPVQQGHPDSTTMYSLMLSSGSPARNFFGMDTSYQLDTNMINALVAYEVNYVGRYLTGAFRANLSR